MGIDIEAVDEVQIAAARAARDRATVCVVDGHHRPARTFRPCCERSRMSTAMPSVLVARAWLERGSDALLAPVRSRARAIGFIPR